MNDKGRWCEPGWQGLVFFANSRGMDGTSARRFFGWRFG